MVLKKIMPIVTVSDSNQFSDSSTKILNDLMDDYKYPIGDSKRLKFSDALKHTFVTIRLDAVDQFWDKPFNSEVKKQFAGIIANDDSFSLLKNDLKQRFQNLKDGHHAGTSFENDLIAGFLKEYQDILFNGVNNFT